MAATLGCFLTTAGCWAMRMAEEKWETFGSHHFEETKRRFSHRRILRSPRSSGFTREAVARHAEGHLGESQPWRRALGRTVNSDAARWMLGLRKSCGVFIIEQAILREKQVRIWSCAPPVLCLNVPDRTELYWMTCRAITPARTRGQRGSAFCHFNHRCSDTPATIEAGEAVGPISFPHPRRTPEGSRR